MCGTWEFLAVKLRHYGLLAPGNVNTNTHRRVETVNGCRRRSDKAGAIA